MVAKNFFNLIFKIFGLYYKKHFMKNPDAIKTFYKSTFFQKFKH